MQKRDLLYQGKAKSVYKTDDDDLLVMEFRNDTSAFDGVKVAQLARKGAVNNYFNAFIMEKLAKAGIPTHFECLLSPQESLVKHLKMVPVECVVRNFAAGSLVRRLGVTEGQVLNPPTFELFLKNDALHDPMINEYLVRSLKLADDAVVEQMKVLTFKVNDVLKPLFLNGKMHLVDYKLEFGLFKGEVVLGDEFTPDGCRVWDVTTLKKLDKDRFRQDLGDVVEAYEEVAVRLGCPLP